MILQKDIKIQLLLQSKDFKVFTILNLDNPDIKKDDIDIKALKNDEEKTQTKEGIFNIK
jgi:hypothetical protein